MANLQKTINLIKKTGDKVIILDQNDEPSYVVMAINDYEKLILGKSEVGGLTEEELLAKINRDITIWKDNKEIEDLPIDQYDFSRDLGEFSDHDDFYNEDEDIITEDDEDKYYFEPVE